MSQPVQRKLTEKLSWTGGPLNYVICDNARYYHCKAVEDDLKTARINLLFLPPYAPNLNLIERLWKFFKN